MRRPGIAPICRSAAMIVALAALVADAAVAQPAFLDRCRAYAGTQSTLDARPYAGALCRCFARKIRADRNIPAQDRKRLLAARPGPGRRISAAAIHAMEKINRACWREVRKNGAHRKN